LGCDPTRPDARTLTRLDISYGSGSTPAFLRGRPASGSRAEAALTDHREAPPESSVPPSSRLSGILGSAEYVLGAELDDRDSLTLPELRERGSRSAVKRTVISDLAFCFVFFVIGAVSVFVIVSDTVPVDYRRLPSFLRGRWFWLDRLDRSESDTIPRAAVLNKKATSGDIWAWRAFWSFFLVLSQAADLRLFARWELGPAAQIEAAVEMILLLAWSVYLLRTYRRTTVSRSSGN
jgi:hypothetical protein